MMDVKKKSTKKVDCGLQTPIVKNHSGNKRVKKIIFSISLSDHAST